ncbi:exo-alpha-sialidase [Microlunatus sp. GCM10028923]|uniref:exo-alpha-sialidase n=1 Tax=Microlunatus sp. GCM10028923 TaxID=3273400 RepID=UPI00360CECD9
MLEHHSVRSTNPPRSQPRLRRALTALVGVGVLVLGAPSAVSTPDPREQPRDGAAPDGYLIAQQAVVPMYEPPPGVIAGNNLADAFDGVDSDGDQVRTVLMSWQSNEDVGTADSERLLARSTDNGHTFPYGYTDTISGFYSKLRDGDILGVEFIPQSADTHTATLIQRRSSDLGATWKEETAAFSTDKTFDAKVFNRGLRIHRDILEDSQGRLLLPYYTKYAEDSAGSAEIAISKDNGKTWRRLSTIFPADGNRAFNETGVSWASNGDLVAVARSHVGSTLSQLYTARSTDEGRTWSAPEPIMITTASGEPAPTTGVMPVLDLLPNGVMTLTFGRPDNWVAISPDGTGRSFEQAQVTYRNFPDQDLGAFQRSHGSSGNGSHAVVGPNRILQVGDNCAPSWGCPPTDSGFHVDGKYRVWKTFIDILAPGFGKIDLRSKVESGAIKINTTMTSLDSKLPELGPRGPLDGSTDWASSAFARDQAKGTYTLTLDREYDLTKAGLSLHRGKASAATVEVSLDGRAWTQVVDTGAVTSYALRYYPLDRVPAKYVRITVNDPTAGGALLNEIELYSTTNSFENEAVDTVPRGYTDAVGATVVDFDTSGDGHALRLADAWKDATAQATWTSDPAATQHLAFRFASLGYPRTLQFVTLGRTAEGTVVPAYQLAVQSDGALASYDAATGVWTKITSPGAAPQKQWHRIRVEATLTEAKVYLADQLVGTVAPTTGGVTGLSGHRFATTGTAPSYDNFVIDDVEQTSPR